MRRAHRWWLAAAGILLALPLLAVAILVWWVDPDSLRPTIEAQVRERFGIALHLAGPLKWKLWPAFAVQSGPGALGLAEAGAGAGAAGATAEPLLRWQALQFTLQWPRRQATEWRLDGLIVDGLRMSLQPDAAGRWNIAALFDAVSDSQARAATPGRGLRIQPLQLRDAQLQVRLTSAGTRWQVSRFNMKTNLDRSGDGVWTLAELQLAGDVSGGPLPAAEAMSLQTARASIDPAGSIVRAAPLQARVGDATLHLTVPQPLRWAPWQGEGEVQFEAASLRGWLVAQGYTPPPTHDAGALGAASLDAHWRIDAAQSAGDGPSGGTMQAELRDLQLRLDDTRLQGRVAGRWQAPQNWRIELTGDSLDADRYRRPDSAPGEPFSLPVDALRALPLDGSVTLQRLSAAGMVARDAVIELHSGAAR